MCVNLYQSEWKDSFVSNGLIGLIHTSGIQQKYIVVTCNYPAREYGVTKLMSIKDAKEKCPSLVLVCGEDLTNYRQMSYKISGLSLNHTLLILL